MKKSLLLAVLFLIASWSSLAQNNIQFNIHHKLGNADEAVQVDLGEFDVNEVEKVKFYIGVEESVNHLDPATYPADHPLAPQFPSMHWG